MGVIANPLSGRDVRRVAARGAVTTSQDKRNRIARAVVGAVTGGATRVIVVAEPFRIATSAIADLHLDARLDVLDIGARLDAGDTHRAASAMRDEGAGAVLVLGGDGTNRDIAHAWPDAVLAPMSTGTNNVFPTTIEATVVGAAAGLVASGRIATADVAPVAKVVRATTGTGDQLALIDAAHLVDDFVGNRMPYEPDSIRSIVMSRTEPASIGVSSIGGLTLPCGADDDHGVLVECGPGGRPLRAPVAPGLYRTVHVREVRTLALDEEVALAAPGIVAYDGDRITRLREGEVTLRVRRDGPRVIDVGAAMRIAAERELFVTDDAAAGDDPLL